MITARGPSVRNPNSYRHGTGIVQTFRSIKTATVIITINARNFVAPRRIRAATQPPIALAVRNTTDARTTYVVGCGATHLEMVRSAAYSKWVAPQPTTYVVLASV